MLRVKKHARPILIAGFIVAGIIGWEFNKPTGQVVTFPYLVDAPSVPPPDAAIDAPPGSPPSMEDPWTRHVIYDTLVGADGVDLADVNGDGRLDVVTPWEDSGKVSVSLHPGFASVTSPWPTVELDGGIGAGEGAIFCDVDQDGTKDVIATSESERIVVYFAPTNPADVLTPAAWTVVTIAAASDLTNWMQSACGDFDGDGHIDIAAGGKLYPGQQVAIFESPTPRNGASWTHTKIGDGGWIMYMIAKDVDGDTDLDLVLSDRTYYGPSTDKKGELTGTRWLENTAGGSTWINHTINRPVSKGDPKWSDATRTNTVYECVSDSTRNFVWRWTTTNWITWTGSQIFGTSGSPSVPANVGQCHDIEPVDVDGDGDDDLLVTFSQATDALSVVIWLRNDGGGVYTRGELSGEVGAKADNVQLFDIDNDGDLDAVVTLAEPDMTGLVWYENPF